MSTPRTLAANVGLSPRREELAQLLAAEKHTNLELAAEFGVAERTIERWRTEPQVVARVAELREAFKDAALEAAPFADRRARVVALDAMAHDLMHQLRQSRYQVVLDIDEHGNPTLGFDTKRVKEFRGCLDDLAKELGDRRPEGGGVQVVVKVYGDERFGQSGALEADWSDAPPPRSSADR